METHNKGMCYPFSTQRAPTLHSNNLYQRLSRCFQHTRGPNTSQQQPTTEVSTLSYAHKGMCSHLRSQGAPTIQSETPQYGYEQPFQHTRGPNASEWKPTIRVCASPSAYKGPQHFTAATYNKGCHFIFSTQGAPTIHSENPQ